MMSNVLIDQHQLASSYNIWTLEETDKQIIMLIIMIC